MTKPNAPRRPSIILSETDAERLSALALQREATAPELAARLLAELERATVRPDDRAPRDVVHMYAFVEYLDAAHGAARTVQLVYPEQADIAAGRISVFTPIGVGLLGLKPGQSILWPDRDGHERPLTVLRVEEAVPA
jgi:regulator of nucleoside diphosphate kinase